MFTLGIEGGREEGGGGGGADSLTATALPFPGAVHNHPKQLIESSVFYCPKMIHAGALENVNSGDKK